jgi:hypothetical protein
MIMLNMGVKEDDFESYILDIYNHCKNVGLTPENIASNLKDLLDFQQPMLYLFRRFQIT